MEPITGLSLAILILTTGLGVYVLRMEREMARLKKRARYLNERLEAVEKFNGLNQTSTDFKIAGK